MDTDDTILIAHLKKDENNQRINHTLEKHLRDTAGLAKGSPMSFTLAIGAILRGCGMTLVSARMSSNAIFAPRPIPMPISKMHRGGLTTPPPGRCWRSGHLVINMAGC